MTECSISEERDMEAWDRAEAAVANYDPADHARGVDDDFDITETTVRGCCIDGCSRCGGTGVLE